MNHRILLVLLAAALVALGLPAQATHESWAKDYLAVTGDYGALCPDQTSGFCLGGAVFEGLSGGTYRVELEDWRGNAAVSGAIRTEPGGATVDVCFPHTMPGVKTAGSLLVWIDGVVFWSLGQACGDLVASQGTMGIVSIRHL